MSHPARNHRHPGHSTSPDARSSGVQQSLFDLGPGPNLDPALAKRLSEQRAQEWLNRIAEAFAEGRRFQKSLPLAEEAIASCPDSLVLMLYAVNAALFQGDTARAQAILKSFDKRGQAPAAELLRAIALHSGGRSSAARDVLKRAKLTQWQDQYRSFPGGFKRIRWLQDHIDGIMGERRAAAKPKPPPVVKGKPAGGPVLVKSPPSKTDAANASSELVSATTPPPPLPPALRLIDVALPFALQFDASSLLSALPSILTGETQSKPHEATNGDGVHWFGLRERLNYLSLVQGFDELLCESQLRGVEPLWHQMETVRKVLRQFHGRVLLADEVGLGKTIEA